jgi:hypothetical protein
MTEPRKNRGWVWFFAVLAVLAVAAVVGNWSYNLSQRLTPEQLQAAQELWKKNGPRDYDLQVQREVSGAGSAGEAVHEELLAKVRGGKVVMVTLNGRPLEPRLFPDYDVEGWFENVERFLEIDRQPNAPRTFTRARFAPTDGHILEYVRRVSGTRERQSFRTQVLPPGD